MMNYIEQINGFWGKFEALPKGRPFHITLYFALLNINNRCGWNDVFSVNFDRIIQMTKLDKNTYYKACEFLYENGFLKYYEKGRNKYQSAQFSFRLLSDKSESTLKQSGIHTESKRNTHKRLNNKTNKQYTVPDFENVQIYFIEKGSNENEALKFFNYNTSRGWKNVEEWQPLAENWILNFKIKKDENKYSKSNRKSSTSAPLGKQDYSARF